MQVTWVSLSPHTSLLPLDIPLDIPRRLNKPRQGSKTKVTGQIGRRWRPFRSNPVHSPTCKSGRRH